jgi:hypothetical protein
MIHVVGSLLLLFSFAWAAGLRTESYPVTSRYDHTSDTTTARLELLNDDGSSVALTLYANVAFRGREPNETGRFWFTLASTQGRADRKSPSQFAINEPVLLTLDDAQMKVPLTAYQREYYELVRRVSESANIPIERNELPRLLTAQEISGQNGNIKFKLSPSALVALREFIARQVLASQPQ